MWEEALQTVIDIDDARGLEQAWDVDAVMRAIEEDLRDRWFLRGRRRRQHQGRDGEPEFKMVQPKWQPPRKRRLHG
eukprot:5255784-Pyramimonas_sp.AAC.1